GMAIGVGNAQVEAAHGAPHRKLRGMIGRGRGVLQVSDVTVAQKWTEGAGVDAALNSKIDGSLASYRVPVDHQVIAVRVEGWRRWVGVDKLSRRIWVEREGQRGNLVVVGLPVELGTLAADIGNRGHGVPHH